MVRVLLSALLVILQVVTPVHSFAEPPEPQQGGSLSQSQIMTNNLGAAYTMIKPLLERGNGVLVVNTFDKNTGKEVEKKYTVKGVEDIERAAKAAECGDTYKAEMLMGRFLNNNPGFVEWYQEPRNLKLSQVERRNLLDHVRTVDPNHIRKSAKTSIDGLINYIDLAAENIAGARKEADMGGFSNSQKNKIKLLKNELSNFAKWISSADPKHAQEYLLRQSYLQAEVEGTLEWLAKDHDGVLGLHANTVASVLRVAQKQAPGTEFMSRDQIADVKNTYRQFDTDVDAGREYWAAFWKAYDESLALKIFDGAVIVVGIFTTGGTASAGWVGLKTGAKIAAEQGIKFMTRAGAKMILKEAVGGVVNFGKSAMIRKIMLPMLVSSLPQTGRSAYNLKDRFDRKSWEGLLNKESVLDGLTVAATMGTVGSLVSVSLSEASGALGTFARTAGGTKVLSGVANSAFAINIANDIGGFSMAAYQFADAERVAKLTGQNVWAVRGMSALTMLQTALGDVDTVYSAGAAATLRAQKYREQKRTGGLKFDEALSTYGCPVTKMAAGAAQQPYQTKPVAECVDPNSIFKQNEPLTNLLKQFDSQNKLPVSSDITNPQKNVFMFDDTIKYKVGDDELTLPQMTQKLNDAISQGTVHARNPGNVEKAEIAFKTAEDYAGAMQKTYKQLKAQAEDALKDARKALKDKNSLLAVEDLDPDVRAAKQAIDYYGKMADDFGALGKKFQHLKEVTGKVANTTEGAQRAFGKSKDTLEEGMGNNYSPEKINTLAGQGDHENLGKFVVAQNERIGDLKNQRQVLKTHLANLEDQAKTQKATGIDTTEVDQAVNKYKQQIADIDEAVGKMTHSKNLAAERVVADRAVASKKQADDAQTAAKDSIAKDDKSFASGKIVAEKLGKSRTEAHEAQGQYDRWGVLRDELGDPKGQTTTKVKADEKDLQTRKHQNAQQELTWIDNTITRGKNEAAKLIAEGRAMNKRGNLTDVEKAQAKKNFEDAAKIFDGIADLRKQQAGVYDFIGNSGKAKEADGMIAGAKDFASQYRKEGSEVGTAVAGGGSAPARLGNEASPEAIKVVLTEINGSPKYAKIKEAFGKLSRPIQEQIGAILANHKERRTRQGATADKIAEEFEEAFTICNRGGRAAASLFKRFHDDGIWVAGSWIDFNKQSTFVAEGELETVKEEQPKAKPDTMAALAELE